MATVPEVVDWDEVSVHILVDQSEVANGTLNTPNLAGDPVGLFQWVWDTDKRVGQHKVEVILDKDDTILAGDENPDNNRASLIATVYDPATLPATEANATWVTAENSCCIVHVVTGTAAYRDLADLLVAVDTAVQQAVDKLGEQPERKFDVYLVDRVIGQGGYAGSAMVVSYLDRQYASGGFHQVLVHEAVHLLDRQFAPQRFTFLAEGLAVWASGGHYKAEELDQRAAALRELGHYVPLEQLINDFYPVQHEVGYLQAAGFVNYLINAQGWSRFRDFYSNVTRDDADTLAESVDVNLQAYYGKTLAQMEAEWLAYLDDLKPDRTTLLDLQTTLRYYSVMRDYQHVHDPAAYFLTAWLPYPEEVEKTGNPADLTRHPQTEVNVTLEVMLQAADAALREGGYNRANVLLDSVVRVLDNDGEFIDPLALNYLNVVRTATTMGYEAQKVTLAGIEARVLATRANTTNLAELDLVLNGQDWVLSN